MTKKFLRTDANRFSKFGNGRGKKAKWRSPKGRHNKLRENIKGHPVSVNIGYRTEKTKRDTFKEKNIIQVYNLKDLEKIKQNEVGIIGKIGEKKKKEIAKEAERKKIKLKNLNPKTYLKKIEKKTSKENKK